MKKEKLTYEQIEQQYTLRKLKPGETVIGFDCGDDDLNDYILHDAPHYSQAMLSVTYVMNIRQTPQVVAYYSLAADSISLSSFPTKTEFNRFCKQRFVNEKRIKSYPAVKLCRLGTGLSIRGSGVGTFLLDAIKYQLTHDMRYGCRFLTVDAYETALGFYLSNGFDFLTEEERLSNRPLLYFDLCDMTKQ